MKPSDLIRQRGVRINLKFMLPTLAVALIVYLVKRAPVTVVAHEIKPASIVAERDADGSNAF